MNPIGIYYAYWTGEWDVDFHPFIDKAGSLGFDVLEVNAGTLTRMTPRDRRALKQHAEDVGLGLSYVVGLTAEYDVASKSKEVRRNGIAFLQHMADAIGDMGGGVLGGIIYGAWPASLPQEEDDRRPFVERSVASMNEAIQAAEENEVIFCLEVVNRFEQFIMNTAEEGVAYLERLDSPRAKLLLDTFHMNIEEASLARGVDTAGSYLGHLHIGENNRTPPGHGHIPWDELAGALRRVKYQGRIVMEPFVTPGGQVGRDIRVHRDLGVGMDLDREAQRSLELIRRVLGQTPP